MTLRQAFTASNAKWAAIATLVALDLALMALTNGHNVIGAAAALNTGLIGGGMAAKMKDAMDAAPAPQ
jgi:hypothetical protein